VSERWSSLRIADVTPITVAGQLHWRPLRRTLGIEAFGINAYTADKAGDDVVERHSEETLRHEEIYVVLSGSGRMKLDDEVIELERLDAIRVAPGVMRGFEADDGGLEILAFSPRREDDRGEIVPNWWTD
jgi:quercetin dioxygenase-like cupin family protein